MYFYPNSPIAFQMPIIKRILFGVFFIFCAISTSAQVFSTPDKFPQEVKNWIMESRFRDAFLVGDRWLAFHKNPKISSEELAEYDQILKNMPSKGFKSGELAYFFVRSFIQFENSEKSRKGFIQVWNKLLEAKDPKTALEFAKQVESWQYNNFFTDLGSVGLGIKGDIVFSWASIDPDSTTDNKPKSQSGPLISFNAPEITFTSQKDTLRLNADMFYWDIKNRFGKGINTLIAGEKMGIPAGQWQVGNFSILPKSGQILSKTSIWKEKDLAIKGEGFIQIKKKAGQKYFSFDFKAEEDLPKALVSQFWKANGRLWISNEKRGLLGDLHHKAKLEIFQKDSLMARALADVLWILPDESVQIPEGIFSSYISSKDSISHERVKMNWQAKSETFHVQKLPGLAAEKLFFEDSFHQLRLSADLAILSPPLHRIDFFRVAAKGEVPAWVESYDFFEPNRLRNTLGVLTYDPLRILYNYFKEKKISSAYLGDIAYKFNKQEADLKSGFYQFRQAGFITIENPGDLLSFTRAGLHYAQVVYEKKDFDQFFVASDGEIVGRAPNMSINLQNKQLAVNGVNEIMVSDSLHAAFRPQNKQLVFTKGRDFDLDGEVKIGNYRFRGPDFRFDFSKFTINFDKIDSITFFPLKKDGSLSNKEVGSELKYESGSILLSPPNNKSGRIANKAFPKLIIPKGVTAYFNEDWRANGVYSTKNYFQVPSIQLDSLLNKEITFEGAFISDGIFPPLKTNLEYMEDLSLGFQYRSKLSLDIYAKKGKFQNTGKLAMEKSGLHGPGQLQLLGISSDSKDVFFYPDSLNSKGISGKITSIAPYNYLPQASFLSHNLYWEKSTDSLIIQPIKNNFKLYNNVAELNGTLKIHQKNVFGQGELIQQEGYFISDSFEFYANNWKTSNAKLRIGKNLKQFKPAIYSPEIAAESDLKQKKINFRAPKNSSDEAQIVFPFIGYQSNGLEATWDIENRHFKLSNKKGFVLSAWESDSTQISDSLSISNLQGSSTGKGTITAKSADYDLKLEFLQLGGVENVSIGPSLIYPFKGQFGIQKDRKFKPFQNAKAVLDAKNERHILNNLQVIDANENYFRGEGDYLLPRSSGDSILIRFKQFEFVPGAKSTDESFVKAEAHFGEKNNLSITPHQWFKGDVLLESNKEFIQFKGFVRPNLGLSGLRTGWIPFEPKPGEAPKLQLNESLNDENGRPVTAGIFINEQNKLYPTFLGPQSDDQDPIVFSAEGSVTEEKDRFVIEGKQSKTELLFKERQFNAYGPIHFFEGNKLLKAAGNLVMSTDTLLPRLNTWLSLQFPFAPELLKNMGEKIVKHFLDEGPSENSSDEPEQRDDYLRRAQLILDQKIPEATMLKMDKDHVPLHLVNPEFGKTINFSRVDWSWLPNTSAFYSSGPISIVNVGNVDINSQIKGFMEVIKKPNKEEFYGYWEISEDLWYFFAYFEGELGVYSSDNAFLGVVRDLVKNGKKDKGQIRIVEAAADEKDAFLKRFTSYYRKVTPSQKTKKQVEKPKETPKPKTKSKQGGF
ncbi:hypothetical protein EOJ36_09630 [Sandaracinomonas limnophila]|uniref:Uncharacterized protein n=1 Tax=Sandaracinomonas limnophila TaxID=1862386 RepID=A0A437PQ00_9BACT|nr:hypothetical protein [Sandaracinomonas limnophila]RVU24174.1 hypothetical protein EOJ36_09630 [Sandaracinomonas limnophila]